MRPGIHYNAVSNIMIQAHARWAVTEEGGKSWGRRGWKGNISAERVWGMKGEGTQAGGLRGDQTHQRVLGDSSSLSLVLSFSSLPPSHSGAEQQDD